ncbi:PPOX class F420-dependent oxidoreductase [Actinophytocola algeriensis]|uniref:PPOX class probable F420-dependent enzyme n=1 Tax=Actinophytocola algeriensis TaxID=1768010 RepID=A0A7W7Q2S1_9PSEU|nr:PPOX class F420-dependent oxidoreductase [Actinophytocola algeriensis]MBB4905726.1 PPOX class probable F420-dependent enzyme [Actinophytocola algeriensis]MBE1472589.1 PPOX class probable F420-dependent enzyme [Actinophytocola algeriensis]
MTKKLSPQELELLNEPQIATVATVMADGSPQLTPVWIDTDGEAILFNTAKGRVKHRNLVRNPKVAVTVVDKDDFYRLVNVRGTAEIVEEGADDHIDKLAKKYLGADSYPWRKADEQRVIVRVIPD